MPTSRKLGRFLGPWLAFATLSGIGGCYIFGLPIIAYGLLSLVLALFLGSDGAFNASESGKSFAEFVQFLVFAATVGFSISFFTGLTTALVGRTLGCWWSFISLFPAIAFAPRSPLPPDAIVFLPVLVFGAFIPIDLTSMDAPRYEWDLPLRRWIRTTWLVSPPRLARFAGIFSPLILWGALCFASTYNEYSKHWNYVARHGYWDTWVRSYRSRPLHKYANRGDCQLNLKQIMLAVKIYTQDYDEVLPQRPSKPGDGVGAVIQPYLRSTRIFQCPSEFYRDQSGNFASGDFTDYWFNARLYGISEATISDSSATASWGEGNTGAGEANAAYSLSRLPRELSARTTS